MKKREYSKEIAGCIMEFLDNDDWKYRFREEDGVFEFTVSFRGTLRQLNYMIIVEDDSYMVYGRTAIGADPDDEKILTEMGKYLHDANYGLKCGKFELDREDGEIRYAVYVDCDEIVPSQAIIRNSIHYTAVTFEKYVPGIMAIIFRGADADEADACSNQQVAERLREMLEALETEEEEGDDEDDEYKETEIS